MKKLSFINAVNTLSRNELRSISGGSGNGKVGCCYLHTGASPMCGLSQSSAQAMYYLAKSHHVTNIGWCCASC